MSYHIVCPYCFGEMEDTEVLFRSEVVHQGEPDILPDDYDDLEDFQARYRGADKEGILACYRDWAFFAETDDPIYTAFWAAFNGTTEYRPADDVFGVRAYRRKIIDPSQPSHQRYLKQQEDGGFLIRDRDGMVTQIELVNGERCNRRVCKHCHNPLPDNYGKDPVKFAAVVGITGAGKTVYLSQLLKRMKQYTAKVGLTAIVSSTDCRNFLENNQVEAGKPLPGSTPPNRLQQPLFYELKLNGPHNSLLTETFVLYDVAGEVFTDSDLVYKFAPFIEHANGVIVLIDPYQFEAVSGVSPGGNVLDDPTKVLDMIHSHVTHNVSGKKCEIPFAICMSKIDEADVQKVFSDTLRTLLLRDVVGVPRGDGSYLNKPEFNAKDYVPIAEELGRFMTSYADTLSLVQQMETNYASYAFFALTALGCDVREVERENGEKYQVPVGPVLPKRVEEPLLWLFYKLGYIGRNAPLPREICCPQCGSIHTYELPEDERRIVERRFFRKIETYVNRCCRDCGWKWEEA